MRDPAFRQAQHEQRYAAHVVAINRLVDELRDPAIGRWVPWVPAYHGGVAARVLLLFQDPGPKTALERGGSGFVGCENDDPTAELLARCLDAAGLAAEVVVPWNAYPWFVPDQGRITASMLTQGLVPLHRLVGLLPRLEAVVTFGTTARLAWHRYQAAQPGSAARYRHLATVHTSQRGITNGGRQRKDVGIEQVVAALRTATGSGQPGTAPATHATDQPAPSPVAERAGPAEAAAGAVVAVPTPATIKLSEELWPAVARAAAAAALTPEAWVHRTIQHALTPATGRTRGRAGSDQAYVTGLVDEVLGEAGLREYRFDWLLGDPGLDGRRAHLPVDAYYPQHQLVVEYHEHQHDRPVPIMDQRATISGMPRGEQRRRYDQYRRQQLPHTGCGWSSSGQTTSTPITAGGCVGTTEPATSKPCDVSSSARDDRAQRRQAALGERSGPRPGHVTASRTTAAPDGPSVAPWRPIWMTVEHYRSRSDANPSHPGAPSLVSRG